MKNKETLIPDEDLKSLFSSRIRKGGSNQYITDCPLCGKAKHFYISRKTQLWDCKKCGEEGNIVKLLSILDKLFLLGDFKSIDREKLTLLSEYEKEVEDDEEIEIESPNRKLPFGFKRVYEDEYLSNRGFGKEVLKKHTFGYTKLKSRFKDYIIVPIIENGENKGYLARLNWNKNKVSEYRKKTGKKELRYLNDKGCKFKNLLFGYDEINEKTDTVILLEGFTDKITLDTILGLDDQDEVKCCATFGKKISKSQISKLLAKGVENIILIFDYDAISEMKKYGIILENFFNVLIGFTYSKDINESEEQEVLDIFDRLNNVHYFNRKFVKTL